MKTTTTKRVGKWLLEWSPDRPSTVWAIPEKLATIKRSDSGILYDNGVMAWNFPECIPQRVRQSAPKFVAQCQATTSKES